MLVDQLEIVVQCSESVGKGHLMRSLALAEQAKARGVDTILVAADSETRRWLTNYRDSYTVTDKTAAVRWRIRDIAGMNNPEQIQLEVNLGTRELLMDEKGPARCYASIVIDAMMTPDRAIDLPSNDQTRYCYGPDYTPLRTAVRDYVGAGCPGSQGRIVVALGYGFPEGYVSSYCRALCETGSTAGLDVLVPDTNPDLQDLLRQYPGKDIQLYVNQEAIGELLSHADLVVTKLGMTQLESFAIGVGCLTVEPGKSHLEVQQALARQYREWPADECGLVEHMPSDKLARKTLELLANQSDLSARGKRGRELVDGHGCERILNVLFMEAA